MLIAWLVIAYFCLVLVLFVVVLASIAINPRDDEGQA